MYFFVVGFGCVLVLRIELSFLYLQGPVHWHDIGLSEHHVLNWLELVLQYLIVVAQGLDLLSVSDLVVAQIQLLIFRIIPSIEGTFRHLIDAIELVVLEEDLVQAALGGGELLILHILCGLELLMLPHPLSHHYRSLDMTLREA